MSRDPVNDGLNKYAMIRNDAINLIDVLGLICNDEKQDWIRVKENADYAAALYNQYQEHLEDYRTTIQKFEMALSKNLPKNPRAVHDLIEINKKSLEEYKKLSLGAKWDWEAWRGVAEERFIKYAKCIEKELGIKNVKNCCCPKGEWTLTGGGGGGAIFAGGDINSYVATCESNKKLQAIITVYTGKIGLALSAGAGFGKGKYYCAKNVVDLLGWTYGGKVAFSAGPIPIGGGLGAETSSMEAGSPEVHMGEAGSSGGVDLESVFTISYTQLREVRGCN